MIMHAMHEHLGCSAPLEAASARRCQLCREQLYNSISCVVIQELSKSAQKLAAADRCVSDMKGDAVEAARLLLGQ